MRKRLTSKSIIKNRVKKIKQLKKKVMIKKSVNELRRENSYFRSLLNITRSINTPRDFNQLLELIVDSAITLTKAERGFLMLFGEDGNLEFRVTRNFDKETLEEEEFKISRTVVNQVLTTGNPLFVSAIYKDKSFKISESILALGLRMVMCVPLKAKENILGVIYVDSHSETESFTRLEEKMFEAFAAQASVAIDSSHLYDTSVHDSLTGLYNYGYLRARLGEEIMRASNGERKMISFVMLDIDNFKSINDSNGHLFGNTILIKVAEVIKGALRTCDIAARYGGDEFAILMPNTDARDAKYLAQNLQKKISEVKFRFPKAVYNFTVSIGIATFPIDHIRDGENIVVEADHALYIAKSKGGNQIAELGIRRKDEKIQELKLIGNSKMISEIMSTVSKIAMTDVTVLIIGETGTGKELITKLVHQKSARVHKPFVVVNCGAIPDNLLESELFGYEKGAFTGAVRTHRGKFEIAHGGTIFLDEIGELPIHLQAKLLRAIEQKEIDHIGGKTPIKVDMRMIAASNRNLEKEVQKGTFRKDLFYRLNVAAIYVSPLRERPEDIEVLSEYYLGQMNKRYRRKRLGFTKAAMEAMMHHPWPGNVRELIHRIERAVIMGTSQYLDENDLGLVMPKSKEPMVLKESRNKAEKESVIQVLQRNRWNITRSSKELGVSRKTLRNLIKKHSIIKPDVLNSI